GSITGTSGTIAVGAASTTQLTVTAPANSTAGAAFDLTVTAKDTYGNVTPAYSGTVHFTGGDTRPTFPPDYTFVGGDNGSHTFSNGATLTRSGNRTITAAEGGITGNATVSVAPAAAATFTVTAPANATAGSAFDVTVAAKDAYANVA